MINDIEYNYCIYGLFDIIIENKIKYIIKKIQNKYINELKIWLDEKPHITISYGPKLDDNDEEITIYNRDKINKLLNDFINKYENLLPKIKFKEINYFDRKADGFYVIKLEFICELIQQMKLTIDPNYQEINWIHITIAILKGETELKIINKIINKINLLIKEINFPEEILINEIQLISAINNVSIHLW